MKKLVSLLVAFLLLACNSAYAQQYLVLPQGTTVNACPTDATTAQKADVYESINPSVFSELATFLGTPVKANDGFVYVPVGSGTTVTGVVKLTSVGTLPGGNVAWSVVSSLLASKLTLGPDGRLWGASPGTKNVVAFDPSSGVSSTYTLATVNDFPAAGSGSTPIVVGADGNLWMWDALFTRLVVVNTSGALVNQYVVPSAGGVTMALGADGRIWYSTSTGVSAIDTLGAVTAYAPVAGGEIFAASDSSLIVTGPSSSFTQIDTSGNLLNTYNLQSEKVSTFGVSSGFNSTAVEINKVLYLCDSYGRLFGIDLAAKKLKAYRSLTLPNLSCFASFDGASIVALANSTLYKIDPGGSVSTTLLLNGERVSSQNPIPIYSAGTTKSCFVVGTSFSPTSANVTDVFTMVGFTGTKAIKVLRVEICAVTGSANTFDCYLIKRSANDTLGTFTTLTPVPLDSRLAAADAIVTRYTANPGGLGASIGNIAVRKVLSFTATAVNRSEPIILFDQHAAGAPITLRGSDCLAINFNGVAKPAQFDLNVTVYWTEENLQ